MQNAVLPSEAEEGLRQFKVLVNQHEYNERVDELNVKKLVVAKDEALETVEVAGRPEVLEVTAVTQTSGQMIVAPSPDLGVPNSEQYAPAQVEHRSVVDHDILLLDTRHDSRARYGMRGDDMPAPLFTNTYRGVALRDVKHLKFFGIARTKLDATKAVIGGERLMTAQMSDKFRGRNFGPHTIHAMQVVSLGAPRAKPVYTARGTVDTGKFPKTGIVMMEGPEKGDRATALPVPRVVNTAAPFEIMHAVMVSVKRDPKRTLGEAFLPYIRRGDVTGIHAALTSLYYSIRDDSEADADTASEMNANFSRVVLGIRALLTDPLITLKVWAESDPNNPNLGVSAQMRGDARTALAAAERPDAYILLPTYDDIRRDVLGSEKSIYPDWPTDAGQCEEKYAANILARLAATAANGMPNYMNYRAGEARLHLAAIGGTYGPRELKDCVVSQAVANSANRPQHFHHNYLYTVARRLDVLAHVVTREAAAAETWICASHKHADKAHMLVTADSHPGQAMQGLLIRHS